MKFRSIHSVSSASPLAIIFTAIAITAVPPQECQAQSAVLSEIYGRGVHAYHSGQNQQAGQWFSMAIDNGFTDPRAYYFRGLAAAASGLTQEAEADFDEGARIEAQSPYDAMVGRSLSRVQGPIRIKLEQTREKARLAALAAGMDRSRVRYGELGTEPPVATAPARNTPPAGSAAAAPRAVMPPSPANEANPFADELGQDPEIDSNDAFKGAMENAKNQPAGGANPAQPAGGANPFGGDAPASDPFAAPAGGADPFATPAGGADPFGGGAGGDAMDDPFGANPF